MRIGFLALMLPTTLLFIANPANAAQTRVAYTLSGGIQSASREPKFTPNAGAIATGTLRMTLGVASCDILPASGYGVCLRTFSFKTTLAGPTTGTYAFPSPRFFQSTYTGLDTLVIWNPTSPQFPHTSSRFDLRTNFSFPPPGVFPTISFVQALNQARTFRMLSGITSYEIPFYPNLPSIGSDGRIVLAVLVLVIPFFVIHLRHRAAREKHRNS